MANVLLLPKHMYHKRCTGTASGGSRIGPMLRGAGWVLDAAVLADGAAAAAAAQRVLAAGEPAARFEPFFQRFATHAGSVQELAHAADQAEDAESVARRVPLDRERLQVLRDAAVAPRAVLQVWTPVKG